MPAAGEEPAGRVWRTRGGHCCVGAGVSPPSATGEREEKGDEFYQLRHDREGAPV